MLRKTIISLTLVAPLFAVPAQASEPDRAVVGEPRDSLRLRAESKNSAELDRLPAPDVAHARDMRNNNGSGDLSPAAQRSRHPDPGNSAAPAQRRAPDAPPDEHINRVISIFR